MADASFIQDSFLGGEWSDSSQGRFTDDRYRSAMNVCFNAFPTESGPWTRRVGTRFLAYTRKGQAAKLIPFHFAEDAPYEMELTDGKLRFHNKDGLVLAEDARVVTAISTADPAVVTTQGHAVDWASGDSVIFEFPSAGANSMAAALLGRQFILTLTSGNTQFSLIDGVTGVPLDGSTFFFDASIPVSISRILELTTPYTGGDWKNLRYVQDEDTVLLLHPTIRPYTVQGEGGCDLNIFQIAPAYFVDGPYLDPVDDGSYFTVSAQTGLITITLGYPAWSSTKTYANGSIFQPQGPKINGTRTFTPRYVEGSVARNGGNDYVSIKDGNLNHAPPNATYWRPLAAAAVIGPSGFTTLDIGRLVRLNSEPADWTATTYAIGDLVKYNDQYFSAAAATLSTDIPGQDPLKWGIATNAAAWTWGIITAVSSATVATVSLVGGDLLHSTPVRDWRLGAWADSTAWPTCATYHESRFWLGGAIPNRFDATKAGKHYSMSPTDTDGTVADDNAIAYVFDSPSQNKIVWFAPDDQGIICGTAAGEWVIKASALNDPLTPTSIQAKRITRYGCASVEPVRAATTLCFVQKFGKTIFEYVPDGAGKFAGLNLTRDANHLTEKGVAELAYQEELVPIIWARIADGTLAGTTYRRSAAISTQLPDFNGWHSHELANGRLVESMVDGPSPDGLTSSITMVTNDPVTGVRFVEQMTQLQPEAATVYSSWFVDSATNPKGASIVTQNSVQGLSLTGLWHLNALVVSAFVGGLDLGDYTVNGGAIFIPFTAAFNEDFLSTVATNLNTTGTDFSGLGMSVVVPTALPTQFLQMTQEPHQFTDTTYLGSKDYVIPDLDHNRFFLVLNGGGPDSGIASFDYTTGNLIKFSRNAELYGRPIPEDWDATVVYQTTPEVLATNGHIYANEINGNVNLNPVDDDGTHWSDDGAIPGIWSNVVTYASGAVICYSDGTFDYYQALIDHPHRDPLADDETQWKPYGGVVPGASLFSPALTYDKGDVVRREHILGIYSSNGAGNLGHNPSTDGGVHWKAHGPLPAKWNHGTAYQAISLVTGSNGHQYANLTANNLGIDPVTNAGVDWQNLNSGPSRSNGTSYTIGFDGFIYTNPIQGAGTNLFTKIDPDRLVSIAEADAGNVLDIFEMVAIQGKTNFIIGTQFGDDTLAIFDTDAMTVHPQNGTFVIDEGQRGAIVGAPPSCACACTDRALILGRSYNGVYADGQAVGLYTLDVNEKNAFTFRKAGAIVPTDVDATWVKFNVFTGGIGVDQTDGNALVFFGAGGSPSSGINQYLAKIDANTGAILWKFACTSEAIPGMKSTMIQHNEYAFFDGNNVSYVNTTTGLLIASIPVATFSLLGAQMYDDSSGKLTFISQFVNGAGSPVLGPNTPTSFTQWAQLTIGRSNTTYRVPGVVGLNYESRGQVVRPEKPEEAGARNGPAMGKTRRTHMFAARLLNTTTSMRVGTDFERMRPLNVKNNKAVAQPANVLYSGEHWDTLEDTYSFSSQLAWKVSRPYPATVLAITQFLHTQDR